MRSPVSSDSSLKLYPFQKDGVERMISFLTKGGQNSVYNADEQGLGKTIQTLTAVNELEIFENSVLRVLIIAPKVMCYTWAKEARVWLSHKSTCAVVSRPATIKKALWMEKIQTILSSRIVIITHESCAIYKELLLKEHFDVLIIDEAHKVKNPKAQRTKVILGQIWPQIKYRIALSGTPMTQSVVDAYSLFSRMAPEVFPSYPHFCSKWSNVVDTMWGPKFTGIKNHKKLSALIREKFFVRRKKAEVLPDLPKKFWKEIVLPASEYLLPEYETEIAKLNPQEIFKKIERGEDVSRLFGLMSSLRRKQGQLKVPAIVEYAIDLLDQGIPLVLFGYHKNVIESYIKELAAYNPVVISGATSSNDRFKAVDDFQAGHTNLFIGQLQSASVGITLTRSSNMILGELDWSPSVLVQAVDRINRIGTTETSLIHYFTVEDSMEDKILKSVIGKAKDFSKVIDGD